MAAIKRHPSRRTRLDVRLEARRRYFQYQSYQLIADEAGVNRSTIVKWSLQDDWKGARDAYERETTEAFERAHRAELLQARRDILSLSRGLIDQALEDYHAGNLRVQSILDLMRVAQMVGIAGGEASQVMAELDSPEERDAENPAVKRAVEELKAIATAMDGSQEVASA